MAGLLGDNWEDPRTMAVLQMGAGLLGGGNFGQAAGRGLSGYQQAMAAAMQEKRAAEEMMMRKQQMEQEQAHRKAQEQAAQRKVMEQMRVQQLLSQAIAPVQGGDANAVSGVTGPRPEALSVVGQRRPVDYQSLIAGGVSPEIVKALSESRNYGRDKVARTVKGMGPDGREFEYQVDEFGNKVGDGLAQYRAPISVGMGGKTSLRDPYSLKEMVGLNHVMSPEGKDASARGWAGVRQAGERLAYEKTQGGAKAPAGYRFKSDGTLESIPGGPADIKAGELGAKADARKAATISSANSVLDTIGEAKKLTGWNTAGAGGVLKMLPMTDARELAGKVETIKANLGFDRLQEMRQNSPTGGALGAVAVQELTALQSTVASLDQLQTPGAMMRALDKIDGHYKRWLEVSGGQKNITVDW